MRRSRRLLLLASALWPLGPAFAQGLGEARVKARLAVTLARFTQWPATAFAAPADPVLVCVAHRSEPIAQAFSELATQTVGGRPIRIAGAVPAEGSGCHVLFVHDSAEGGAAPALAAVTGQPVLTVGDSDGFAARGGMVGLVNVDDAIRLDVNLRVIRAARLELSSRVLQLARNVRE